MDFSSYVLESADFTTYDKADINHIANNLNSSKITAEKIAYYLEDKNVSLTKKIGDDYVYENAEAKLVFDNISSDLEKMFKYYSAAMEGVSRVYRNNVTKGVYSNDFAYTIIDSAQYYVEYFYNNFKDLNTSDYKYMAVNFKNFTTNYLKNKSIIVQYNTSTSLQEKVENIVNMPSVIPTISLQSIVTQKLAPDVTDLSEDKQTTVNLAVNFLKGGLSA